MSQRSRSKEKTGARVATTMMLVLSIFWIRTGVSAQSSPLCSAVSAQSTPLCGDINNDGQVDLRDALSIAQFLAGNAAAPMCALTPTASATLGSSFTPTPSVTKTLPLTQTPTRTPRPPTATPPPPTTTFTPLPSQTPTSTRTPTAPFTSTPHPPTLTQTPTLVPTVTSTPTLEPGATRYSGQCAHKVQNKTGLDPCPQGTAVNAYLCQNQAICLGNPEARRSPLGATSTDASGNWDMSLNENPSIIIFVAIVDGTEIKLPFVFDIGIFRSSIVSPASVPPAPSTAANPNEINVGTIDPNSEGVARALNSDGFENFAARDVKDILDKTRSRAQGPVADPNPITADDTTDGAAGKAHGFATTLIEPQLQIFSSADGRTAYYTVWNTSIFDYRITTVAIDGGGGDGGVNSCQRRGTSLGGAVVGDDLTDPAFVKVSLLDGVSSGIGFAAPGAGRVCLNCANDDCRNNSCASGSVNVTFTDAGLKGLTAGDSPLGIAAATVPIQPSFGTCQLTGQTYAFGQPPAPTTRTQRLGAPPADGFTLQKGGEAIVFANETTTSLNFGFGIGGFRINRNGTVIKGLGIDTDTASGREQLSFGPTPTIVPINGLPRAIAVLGFAPTPGATPAPADLVVADDENHQVLVLPNQTSGFGSPTAYAVGKYPAAIAVGDLNGDGKSDLVVANEGTHDVSVLLATTPGVFMPAQSLPVEPFPIAVALGDVDGDGKLDIVTAHDPDTVTVLLNQTPLHGSAAVFSVKASYHGASYPAAIAAADVDGDHKADVITADEGSGTVSVWTSAGKTLSAPVPYAAVAFPGALVAVDFDGDGKPDIAVTSQTDHVVLVMLNKDGTFPASKTTPYRIDPPQQCVGLNPCPAGLFPAALTAGDIDGDGTPDLLTANEGSGDVTVLLNIADGTGHPTGTFDPPRYFPAAAFPFGIAAADFNGSGRADLAVIHELSKDTVLLNQQ